MTEKQEKTARPKSPVAKVLIKVGSTAWILLAGLALIFFVLSLFGIVNKYLAIPAEARGNFSCLWGTCLLYDVVDTRSMAIVNL